MFRPNPKKLAEKASKEIGRRLRKLCKTYDDKVMLAEAAEIVELHGHDPLVINSVGSMGYTPIFWAVWRRHEELALRLANAAGLDAAHQDAAKENILLFALQSHRKNHALIQLLLERTDINISAKNARGEFALLVASISQECYIYLPQILSRTDTNIVFDFGECLHDFSQRTPLIEMVCTYANSTAVNKPMLLQCITDLLNMPICLDKKKIKSRQRALDYALLNAAQYGNPDVVALLLAAGASTTVRDRNGHTAAQMAKYNNHPETANLIINNNAPLPIAPPAEFIAAPLNSAPNPAASAPPLEEMDGVAANVCLKKV